jgi:hypothetical protein
MQGPAGQVVLLMLFHLSNCEQQPSGHGHVHVLWGGMLQRLCMMLIVLLDTVDDWLL